jgi:type II secretory pathway component PulF
MISGISLQDSLRELQNTLPTRENYSLLERLLHKADMRKVSSSLLEDILNGHTLKKAMSRYPNIFGIQYLSLVEAGEYAGNMIGSQQKKGTLSMIIRYLERKLLITQEIKARLRYPLIVLGIMVLLLFAMAYLILPILKEFLLSLVGDKDDVFFVTRLLFLVADLFTTYWYVPLLALIGTPLVTLYWLRSAQGIRWWHSQQLKIKLFRVLEMAEFFSLLSTLYGAGINWSDLLPLLKQASTNIHLRAAIEVVCEAHYNGAWISEAFRKAHVVYDGRNFTILNTAIKTGRVEETLTNYSEELFREARQEIDAYLTYIEPALIGFIGLIVGFVVIGFYGGLGELARAVVR